MFDLGLLETGFDAVEGGGFQRGAGGLLGSDLVLALGPGRGAVEAKVGGVVLFVEAMQRHERQIGRLHHADGAEGGETAGGIGPDAGERGGGVRRDQDGRVAGDAAGGLQVVAVTLAGGVGHVGGGRHDRGELERAIHQGDDLVVGVGQGLGAQRHGQAQFDHVAVAPFAGQFDIRGWGGADRDRFAVDGGGGALAPERVAERQGETGGGGGLDDEAHGLGFGKRGLLAQDDPAFPPVEAGGDVEIDP